MKNPILWTPERAKKNPNVVIRTMTLIEVFAPYEKQGQNVGSISTISRVRSLILRFPRGMSAGSFFRTAAGDRASVGTWCNHHIVVPR